jgi:hypothetical protein
METLIKRAFEHVDVLGPLVDQGHYDILGPDGEIILPQLWETMIEPDWAISMHMWPIPDSELKDAGSPLSQPPHPLKNWPRPLGRRAKDSHPRLESDLPLPEPKGRPRDKSRGTVFTELPSPSTADLGATLVELESNGMKIKELQVEEISSGREVIEKGAKDTKKNSRRPRRRRLRRTRPNNVLPEARPEVENEI